MEKSSPSSFAKVLVERYEKGAYARAVTYLIEKHRDGDRAGEHFGLQLVMAVQQLLQAQFPEDGIISSSMLSIRYPSCRTSFDGRSAADEPCAGGPDQAEARTRTLH